MSTTTSIATRPKYPMPELARTLAEASRVIRAMDLASGEMEAGALLEFADGEQAAAVQMAFEEACMKSDNWNADGFEKTLLSLRQAIPTSTAFPLLLADDSSGVDQCVFEGIRWSNEL